MAAQQRTSGIFARTQALVDRVVSPDTRGRFYSNVGTFSHEQPLLATFLFIQLILSFTPLALFISFTIGTLLLSLITALVFSLFWIGVALLVLVPTLFITVSLGIAVWIWAVTSFLVARWVYNVVPINVKGKAEMGLPNGKKVVVNKRDGWTDTGEVKGEVVDGH
ncbi:hypothetical protein D0Z07_1373 [Hyphodiscus hymeniophilus]|uniref:Uncharacterized protein n=1 Tax=Hyphodiscus hymeniophilus TaxID=353542 RepID=A0A9P6VRT1_9HELO|nr:hypothetical protein D0Z07_1373 [Hyphodiscus hymeniophilus]